MERGGKNAKKRAVEAAERKLSILLHRLWVSGEVYELLRTRGLARSGRGDAHLLALGSRPQNQIGPQYAESLHRVSYGLVFFWCATVVEGELLQAVLYRGFRRPNSFWRFGPVRFQHNGGVERVRAVVHLRNDVTSATDILFNSAHHLGNVAPVMAQRLLSSLPH